MTTPPDISDQEQLLEDATAFDNAGFVVEQDPLVRRTPVAWLALRYANRSRRSNGPILLRILLPLLAMAVFFFLWDQVPLWLGLHTYELPRFSQDVSTLITQWAVIGPNLKITVVDALSGFAVGNLLAVLAAVAFSQSRLLEWTFFPLAILIQTIPVVVIAPLSQVIFTVLNERFPIGHGIFDPTASLPIINEGSKPILLVTVVITFFPTLVNMTVGLRAIDPNLFDFMRLLNASRWAVLWRLRLPSSMPYLFSSFKITSTLCFVGAFVGEWMLANETGIGGLVNLYNFALDKQGLWAAVMALSVASMAFFALVVIAERILVPWRQER